MEPKKLLTTLALVSVVLIAGCKKDTFVEIPGVCPEVISTDPANLATGVPLNKVITATFNKVMNPATITQASFTVKGASAITGTVSYTGTTASFVPSSPLTPNTTYTGTISKSVKDLIRQSPKYDYVWTFTTIMPSYTVAVSSNPLAGGTTSGSGTFISGSSVTVTAAANAGYTFTNWTESGTIVSTTTPYIFTISGNRTLVANYTAQYTVAVSSSPLAGGTTSGSGTFNSGASVTVTAVANTGYTFTNWTESGAIVSTTTPYIFTISGNRTLVANYTAQYTVAVSSNPLAGGTTSGSGTFNSGDSVTVTAVANTGYTFTNWTESGTIVSTTTPYIFTISGNRILVANYTAAVSSYTVTLSANPLAGGTQSGAGAYNSGSSVTVTAVANAGYTFTNWTESGTIVSTTTPYIFTISGNRTLVANYTAAVSSYTVTLSANPLAGGTQTGAGAYNSGALVTVKAIPAVGYSFTNWTESGIIVPAALAEYTFTISGNRTLVANYTPRYTVTVSTNPSTLLNQPTGGGTFNSGTSVTVTAVANAGYTFTNWTESGIIVPAALAEYTFTISGNRTLVANYTPRYTVTLSANPLAGGTPTGAGTFNSDALVTVKANPAVGYSFTYWTESEIVVSTTADYTFIISGNRTLVANYTVTIVPWLFSSRFGVFGGTAGMTNMGDETIIKGDIGTMATGTSAITGFHDSGGDIYTETCPTMGAALGCGIVTGKIYTCTNSTTGPTCATCIAPLTANPVSCGIATVGRGEILAAYNALVAMPVSGVLLPANLAGLTVAPGVYSAPGGSFMIQDGLPGPEGDLTLAGTATDVWVFQMATTLDVGGPGAAFPRSVKLTGGALAKNVYWQVGSFATINAAGGGNMVGTIISQEGASFGTAPPGPRPIINLNGRVLSLGASVTLVNTVITLPE